MIYRDFEDILIKPNVQTQFISRSEVELENELGQVPICAANMYGVGTISMALELQKYGMMTFLNKDIFLDGGYLPDERMNDIDFLFTVPTFGITNSDFQSYEKLIDGPLGEKIQFACIDVANGHMSSVIDRYSQMKELSPHTKFFVGNIANEQVLEIFAGEGIFCIVGGVGQGSVCSTRLKTGIGVPQASLIQALDEERQKKNLNIKIMSDGGIKHVGDISKALVLGADYVMMGGMFSGHRESELTLMENGKYLFKGSSAGQKKDYVTDEGVYVQIDDKGPVEATVRDILGGLRSTGSYLDSHLRYFSDNKDLIIEVNRQKNNIYDGISYEKKLHE